MGIVGQYVEVIFLRYQHPTEVYIGTIIRSSSYENVILVSFDNEGLYLMDQRQPEWINPYKIPIRIIKSNIYHKRLEEQKSRQSTLPLDWQHHAQEVLAKQ